MVWSVSDLDCLWNVIFMLLMIIKMNKPLLFNTCPNRWTINFGFKYKNQRKLLKRFQNVKRKNGQISRRVQRCHCWKRSRYVIKRIAIFWTVILELMNVILNIYFKFVLTFSPHGVLLAEWLPLSLAAGHKNMKENAHFTRFKSFSK